MKTLKIIVVLVLVAFAATLLIASVYAYTGGHVGKTVGTNSAPAGTAYGYYGGMMRGYGYSNPVGTTPQPSGTSLTTTPTQPSNQYPIDGYGCRNMMNRIP